MLRVPRSAAAPAVSPAFDPRDSLGADDEPPPLPATQVWAIRGAETCSERGEQGSCAVAGSAAGGDCQAECFVDLGEVAGGGVEVFGAVETY